MSINMYASEPDQGARKAARLLFFISESCYHFHRDLCGLNAFLYSFTIQPSRVVSLDFSNEGDTWVAATADGNVFFYNVFDGEYAHC
jgi:WD40 repeat protein